MIICNSPKFACNNLIKVKLSYNNQEFFKKGFLFLVYKYPFFYSNFKPGFILNDGNHFIEIYGREFLSNSLKSIPNYYCKYIKKKDNKTITIVKAIKITANKLTCRVPKLNYIGKKIIVEISRNKIDWFNKISPMSYLIVFKGPEITSLVPNYANANLKKNTYITVHGKNFKCIDKKCDKLTCKFIFFKEGNFSLITKAKFINNETISCLLPKVNRPDVVNLKISNNGKDYSHNGKKFNFYDPFIVELSPNAVSVNGIEKKKIF